MILESKTLNNLVQLLTGIAPVVAGTQQLQCKYMAVV